MFAKMIYQLLVAQLVILWVRPQEGASIEITRPPQNQTICEGDNVTITCGFDGIDIIPNWIINGVTFGNTAIMADSALYVPNVDNTNDTVLIMLSVNASMNGTRTQCELNTRNPILSSTAVLTIMGTPLRPNLIVTEVALDSFTVSWNTFSHSACGDVTYNITLFEGLQLIVENITAMNDISFTDLNDTTLYRVSVFATNDAGSGSTMSINVTTLTPAIPSPPRELKVNTLFIDYEPTVWITWTSPLLTRNMTEVEAYNVTLYDKDQLLSFTILQSQTVLNLSLGLTYTISVSAMNSVGYSTAVITTINLELHWLQSATISLSTDNKTVVVTCEVIHASPQAECLVTINCTKCNESSYTFSGSIQLTISPAHSHSGYYLVSVQAIRSDNNEPLEDYNITQTLQIPEISKPSVDNTKTEDSEDDDPIWIYIVIAIAVLIVIVVGILILSIIYYYIMKKRRAHPLGYDDDDEIKRSNINGYTRHSESPSDTERYHHMKNGLDNGKSNFNSKKTITNSGKDVTTALLSNPSDSPTSITQDGYSQVDLIKDKDVTIALSSNPSDSSAPIKRESYSQVDLLKKHNKTNYVELGAFDTKQPTLMPMGAPHVKYTEVKLQSDQNKQENSS